MLAISNSEMKTWQRCRRKWFLSYYLGTQPADPEVTGVRIQGTRIHSALEGHYGYQLDPVTTLGALYQAAITAFPDHDADLRAEWEQSRIMVEGYLEWVAAEGVDASLTVVATETDLAVPIPGTSDQLGLRAKLDQVVWDSVLEAYLFLDHKNSASFDAHEEMALDPQFKFYSLVQLLAAGEGGPRVAGGIRNTLRRVKRTAKSKPPYYRRDVFRYNPAEIESTLDKVTRIAYEIYEARLQLDEAYEAFNGDLEVINPMQRTELPPNEMPSDCRWSCPFVTLCPMMNDGSDWPGVVTRSGRFTQGDPYDYYSQDPLRDVRARLTA
jgi:hypothetical protein